MATRTDYFNQAVFDHIYLNADLPNIGDAAGLQNSVVAGNLYAALFVGADECTYGNYARVAIPRSAAGFVRTGNVGSNVSQINFPLSSSGVAFATKLAIYDRISGGEQLHIETMANQMYTGTGHMPIIEAGSLTITLS